MNRDIQEGTGLRTPDGVAPDVWLRLARCEGDRWVIAERGVDGQIVGEAHRFNDGSKRFVRGGRRGLIVDWPLDPYAGSSSAKPIYVCEGASDTAAALSLGLDAVGIPMTGACADELAQLLKDRHAVVIADCDEAGERGARKVIGALLGTCASVRLILPPEGAKDTREAVVNGATREDFETLTSKQPPLERIDTQASSESALPSQPVRTFDWLSLDDLGPAERPRWVWPGCVARGGITLLTGLWKAGKTTMILHLLRDLYKGTGMVNEKAEGPTLIVSEEGPAAWASRRVEYELDGRIQYLARDTYARLTKEEWPVLVENIVRTTKQRGAELVIIDTLANLWPVVSENDAAEVLDALAPLRDITQAGAGLLLLHHPRKGEGGSFTASRGSGALPAFADVLIELRRYDTKSADDTRRVVQAVGRFEGIPAERIFELTEAGYIELDQTEADSLLRPSSDPNEHLAAIIAENPGLCFEDIRDNWTQGSLGKARMQRILTNGVQQGLWTRTGAGHRGQPFRYYPNDHVLSMADEQREEVEEGEETEEAEEAAPIEPVEQVRKPNRRQSRRRPYQGEPVLVCVADIPRRDRSKKANERT